MLPSLSNLDRRTLERELEQHPSVDCLQHLLHYGQTDIIHKVVALLQADTTRPHGHAQSVHVSADWQTDLSHVRLSHAEMEQITSHVTLVNPQSWTWKLTHDKLDAIEDDNPVLFVPGVVKVMVSTVAAPHEHSQTARYSREVRADNLPWLEGTLEVLAGYARTTLQSVKIGPLENGVPTAETFSFEFYGTPTDMYDTLVHIRNITETWMRDHLKLDVLIEDCNSPAATEYVDFGPYASYELSHTTSGILMHGINSKLSRLSALNKEFLKLLNPEIKQGALRRRLKRKRRCDDGLPSNIVVPSVEEVDGNGGTGSGRARLAERFGN